MTRRTRGTVVLVAFVGLIAATVVGPATAPVLDVEVERYLGAAASATVEGRAYEEPRPRETRETPLPDTTVVLLPRSEALLARLAAIKAGARASLGNFRSAASAMRHAYEEFESALRAAGGEPLVRLGAVDQAGRFAFESLPQGQWVVLAWRSVFVDTRTGTIGGRSSRLYTLEAPVEGYRAVSFWVRELTLEPSARQTLELTDRNVWFSGVEEVKRTGAGR